MPKASKQMVTQRERNAELEDSIESWVLLQLVHIVFVVLWGSQCDGAQPEHACEDQVEIHDTDRTASLSEILRRCQTLQLKSLFSCTAHHGGCPDGSVIVLMWKRVDSETRIENDALTYALSAGARRICAGGDEVSGKCAPPVIKIAVPRKRTEVIMFSRKRQMVRCGLSGRCFAAATVVAVLLEACASAICVGFTALLPRSRARVKSLPIISAST